MQRTMAFVLCLLALLAPLPGCAGSGHVKITALKTPYFEIGITISWDFGDEDYCLWGQFLDKDGNPMGPEVGGGSSGTMAIPQGAAYIKYRIVECDEDQPESLGPVHPIHPAQLGWYTTGLVAVDDQVSPLVHYGLAAQAGSPGQAQAKANAIMQGGPGTPVGADIQVYSFVEFTAGASVSTIETSLPNTFRSAQVTIDGTVVADLASGLNCKVIDRANNWQTLQISLPTSIAPAGSLVELTQVGAPGAGQELNVEMQL